MKNKLLVTTAMAALIGCTTLAMAQETKEAPGKPTTSPQAAPHPGGGAPGGAMSQPGGAMKPGGEMKPSGGAAQNTPPKASEPQQGQAQERSGQGAPENRGVSQSEQSNPNSATNRRGAQEERGTSQEQRGAQGNEPNKPAGESQRNAQGAAPNKGGANVKLSDQQRTQVKDIIVKDRNVARVDHVDFSINVGVAVPRSVHVAVLPPEVVTIVPEYSGFEYIIVGDQLLIIDPNTMEIVYILPA
jgi:Protein of unknown function (DUF1236)